jgi:hypothetical protein
LPPLPGYGISGGREKTRAIVHYGRETRAMELTDGVIRLRHPVDADASEVALLR